MMWPLKIMELKFREDFKSFASIKNTFEISDPKAFTVLSGVNGVGKSQFLKAISEGHIEVQIDGGLYPTVSSRLN